MRNQYENMHPYPSSIFPSFRQGEENDPVCLGYICRLSELTAVNGDCGFIINVRIHWYKHKDHDRSNAKKHEDWVIAVEEGSIANKCQEEKEYDIHT